MSTQLTIPQWALLHVPHNSSHIPADVRDQFIIDDEELETELTRMTDHHTLELFGAGVPDEQIVQTHVSRLVADVERFEDDAHERMAERGMGAVYMSTSQLSPLRRTLTPAEREALLNKYYRPHHLRLTQAVDSLLEQYGQAFVLDCHSFPSKSLPYEFDTVGQERPDICLGTDSFHTPKVVTEAFASAFAEQGFSVAIDTPFAGSLVPLKHYQTDERVSSIMIEVNRTLYIDESTGLKNNDFQNVQLKLQQALGRALAIT